MSAECAGNRDHGPIFDPDDEADRQSLACATEGICPACKLAGQRNDDGFTTCPCCGVQWAVQGRWLVGRFDASAFLADRRVPSSAASRFAARGSADD